MYNLEINDSTSKNRITLFDLGFIASYELIRACEKQEHISIDVEILSLKEKMTAKEFLGVV